MTGDVTLVLADLDALLRERARIRSSTVVEAATGPLRDRAAEREARLAPIELLAASTALWAERVRISGLLSRVADPVGLVQQAIAVRVQLGPAQPGCAPSSPPRSSATRTRSMMAGLWRPWCCGRLVDVMPGSAAGRREAWEGLGVLADTVSTSVLTLGTATAGGRSPRAGAAGRGRPR